MKYTTVALLCTAISCSAQIAFVDEFDNGSIDPVLWSVDLPTASSAVTETAGVLKTTARGILGTNQGIAGGLSLMGRFRMLDGFEHFTIALRSDLATSSYFERTGLRISFANDGDMMSISRYMSADDNTPLVLYPFSFQTGTWYEFAILDLGEEISVSLNGELRMVANSAFRTGDRIGMYSRKFNSTSTEIDYVRIAAIPEPATFWAVLLGIGLLFFRDKRRLTSRCSQRLRLSRLLLRRRSCQP
jgi:hypothetical protein